MLNCMATNSQVVKPRIERAHNGCRPDLYSLSTVLKAVLQTNVGLVAHIEKEGVGGTHTLSGYGKRFGHHA